MSLASVRSRPTANLRGARQDLQATKERLDLQGVKGPATAEVIVGLLVPPERVSEDPQAPGVSRARRANVERI